MNIIKTNLNFKKKLSIRKQTNYIILHHRAGNGDVTSIHNQHIAREYSGIGYHYYIRKDGLIYSGRPVETIGAHCVNYNSESIGICFEGNFEKETMGENQINSGKELIQHLKKTYPNVKIIRHKDKGNTCCPGKNFPFSDITKTKEKLSSSNDIIWELMNGQLKIEINNIETAVNCLEKAKTENNSLYWILYKIVNKE